MSKLIVLDTETSGLPLRRNAPVSDLGCWPRLVSVAWSKYVDDVEYFAEYHIIAPLGWEIPVEASDVHGITEDYALAVGEDIVPVLEKLIFDMRNVDVVVSHNIPFDLPVLGAECLRAGLPNPFENCNAICTMLNSIEYCQLPYPSGRKGWKYPKLAELHTKLFGVGFDNAHNAVDDVRACYRCYVELKRIGVIQ